ncbi:MAG: type II toxin-antitoxin system Phd/YefM family antitoxin [Gemmatimonadota bacterium]
MKKVNIYEAKSNFSKLLREVAAGEEIVIAKGGRPIARLVPIREGPRRKLGIDRGQIWIADDFDELTPELLEDFYGNDPA